MKEHPIIFSGPMVRAILEGRKTQTRRVIADQPSGPEIFKVTGDTWFFRDYYYADEKHDIGKYVTCPYGQTYDRLWVRETWQAESYYDGAAPSDIDEDSNLRWISDDSVSIKGLGSPFGKVRPSIHMPRWASRITLEILNIRVERLQQISRADARAEGVSHVWEWTKERSIKHPEHFKRGVLNPYVANYSVLWDSINAKRGHGWDSNPWVWILEFKKTT